MTKEEKLKKSQLLLEKYNQQQLLKFFNEISPIEQERLLDEILSIDFELMASIYSNMKSGAKVNNELGKVEPADLFVWNDYSDEEKSKIFEKGMELISEGKAAVVLVAGGQGTRLGHNGPKGTFSIGLPSGKTLFQIQCERLINLSEKAGHYIPWYIMTSPENHEATVTYFEDNNYLGYKKDFIYFFKQEVLPMIDTEGKILLESKYSISKGPNGNGGCFVSMKKTGVIEDMKRRGIEWVHLYGVDNALVVPANPGFLGFTALSGLPASGLAIRRIDPEEKAGVFCYKDGKPTVIEYMELQEDLKYKRNSNGELVFKSLSIANHIFNIEVIEESPEYDLPYHIAFKKISTVDEVGNAYTPASPNGYKFEMFMFDVFPFLKDIAVFEMDREEVFAPVKNREGIDSPETARTLVLNMHRRWLLETGVKEEELEGKVIEISPLTSCFGENLNPQEIVVNKASALLKTY
jgi:UDP-N-acetylglucosamine/UDP-N-acetylgalactosamine diphosphorylase